MSRDSLFVSGCSAHPAGGWRARWYRIVFQHDTRAGLLFDIGLIVAILVSVGVTVADSIVNVHREMNTWLYVLEWAFTLAFTAEYVLRLMIVDRPARYARSAFGIIDLLAILPTYLSLLFPGAQVLLIVRVLRVLRIFRLLKMARYVSESGMMLNALQRSWRKILIFILFMLGLATIFGALMYVIEGPQHGFTSIPMGMYWAIVTVSTVGYGDLSPGTVPGRMVTSVLILIGYGILAVPTGIFTAELLQAGKLQMGDSECDACGLKGHLDDARYCRRCGQRIPLKETGPAAAASTDQPRSG